MDETLTKENLTKTLEVTITAIQLKKSNIQNKLKMTQEMTRTLNMVTII